MENRLGKGEVATARNWVDRAIAAIEADQRRSADTHLWKLDVPALTGIDLYLKDESTHPTGSLKHRLARSLFLYALCNGHIREGTAVVEASSGSTAVSEAYFARMIGIPFFAVMPRSTSPATSTPTSTCSIPGPSTRPRPRASRWPVKRRPLPPAVSG